MSKANVKDKSAYVTTYDGVKALRKDTRFINGDYYIPNRSCFKINNRWYRITSQYIALDARTKEYALKDSLMEGVISITKSGNVKLGYFSWDGPKEALVRLQDKDGNTYLTFDESIIPSGFVYSYERDAYVISTKKFPKKIVPYWFQQGNKLSNYFWDDGPISKAIQKYYDSYTPNIRPEYQHLERVLGNFTFGLEFESTKGTIPSWKLFSLGLIPVRDGSISGYEYTTVPLKGAKGLQTIENICTALSEYCLMDYSCSLHIHVGNIRNDKLYLLAVYAAAVKVQQEMFSIVPYFKRDQRATMGSQKDYCKALPPLAIGTFTAKDMEKQSTFITKVENDFKVLFKFLSGGYDLSKDYNRNNHPQGNQKWNQLARYHWLNLMNMVFGKNQTVEFRIHQGTFNPTKVLNWLFICIGFLKFVDSNTEEIFNPKFAVVLNDFADIYSKGSRSQAKVELSRMLKDYLAALKVRFREYELAQNYIPKEELANDLKEIPQSILSLPDFFGGRLGHFDVSVDEIPEENLYEKYGKSLKSDSIRKYTKAPWEISELPSILKSDSPKEIIGNLYPATQVLSPEGGRKAQFVSILLPGKNAMLFQIIPTAKFAAVTFQSNHFVYDAKEGELSYSLLGNEYAVRLRNGTGNELYEATRSPMNELNTNVKSKPSKGAPLGTKHYPKTEGIALEEPPPPAYDIW